MDYGDEATRAVEEAAVWLYTADREWSGVGRQDGPTWDTETDDTRAYWRALAGELARRGLPACGESSTEWGVRCEHGYVVMPTEQRASTFAADLHSGNGTAVVCRTVTRTEWRTVDDTP